MRLVALGNRMKICQLVLTAFVSKLKKVWLAKQVDSEEAKRKMEQVGPEDAKRLRLPTSVKSERSDKKKAVETAQWRRDITPLDSDIFRFQLGHDFVPQNPDKFPSIRKGWPLHAKDYPVGYSVCTPPGFCWDGCDCMDDQRGQREWEVTKSWIPKARGLAAQAAIDNFSRESNFVRARGQVSKTFYFETASALVAETPAPSAALHNLHCEEWRLPPSVRAWQVRKWWQPPELD